MIISRNWKNERTNERAEGAEKQGEKENHSHAYTFRNLIYTTRKYRAILTNGRFSLDALT